MTNNWKISVFFAGLAFCISLLFGLIGGVGFGTLILRAFLGALAFGGLGFAADVFLRRFLPELFTAGEENGEGVDITVPEVNPHDRSGDEEFAAEAGISEAAGGQQQEDSDDLVEEIEELPHSEADTAPAAAAQEVKTGEKDPLPQEDAGDLDVLPDVGELDAGFAAAENEEDSGIFSKPSGGSGKAAAITDDQNPALLAKALQTVLKRDTEG
ncbi:MAG: ABC transporter permease [Spirochaetales bacterium]|jgi:hypothetical protein|nr:ABC transporter permease [Spirochaetales bacterium]